MEIFGTFFLHSKRLAVQEKLHFISIAVICPYVDDLSRLPVPVREDMQDILLRIPFALVHIIYIFRESCQIDDAEIGTSGRPWIRGRLTDIVESRPDILSADEIIEFHVPQSLFLGGSPRDMTVVIGRAFV